MKKWLVVFMTIVLIASLSACGEKKTEEKPVVYEIAMVTDTNNIEDGAFNETAWKGIEDFVNEHPVSYKSYLTTEDTSDAYMRAIDEAVDGGAKIVIAAGAGLGNAVYHAQERYPKVSFVILDGQPYGKTASDIKVAENTVAIMFAEEQAGYLAGYAAVKEGYQALGFMGGKPMPPVERFGYGFVQGADEAARESGVSNIKIKYCYSNTFNTDNEVEKVAKSWYSLGTDVIFSCAGGAGKSVMKAAEQTEGKVIGVDVDQSGESKTIIVSAVKNIGSAVNDILWEYYVDGEFEGGKTIVLAANNGGVGLSIDTCTMTRFGRSDYDGIFKKLADNKITIKRDGIKTIKDLETDRVKVEIVK